MTSSDGRPPSLRLRPTGAAGKTEWRSNGRGRRWKEAKEPEANLPRSHAPGVKVAVSTRQGVKANRSSAPLAAGGCGQERAGEIGQGGCLCASRDAADRVVPRGVCEVGRQSPAEGDAGGARSVGASQTCARQSGARSTAAVWHST